MTHAPDAIADHALLTVSRWQRGASVVTVRLYHLDGRPWASAGFLSPFTHGAKWDWIRETVAHECGVDEDQVGCVESDDGDLITVDGLPVYRCDPLGLPCYKIDGLTNRCDVVRMLSEGYEMQLVTARGYLVVAIAATMLTALLKGAGL